MADRAYRERDYDNSSSSDILHKKPSRSFSMKGQKPPEVRLRSILSRALTHFSRAKEDEACMKHVREMWEVVEAAWQIPAIGRDLASEISDTLRREKVVEFLIANMEFGGHSGLRRECARLLSQILTTDNRHYVSKSALHILTKYTKLREDIDLVRINMSILESLFKDSEATCTRLFDLGALDSVLHACRHDDLWTARFCSSALANAAVFGGGINHKRMIERGAQHWIFPLAFRTDDVCRFYACLAIAALAANPAVEGAVIKSGTLSLVEPFVQTRDPYEFAQACPSHTQGSSASFLLRVVPLLISSRPESQALASFYFAMEASIKAHQQKTQIFSEVCSIVPLKRVIATSRSTVARILATRCLKIIGEDVPRRLSPQIHTWDIEDVQSWLAIAGFRSFNAPFRASTVDGEMLLLLTENDLKHDLEMTNNLHRKRFLRDLNHLRAGADYRSLDSSGIADWLRNVEPKFAQYTFRLLQVGVDMSFLPKLTDDHLRLDCGIDNGVHRTKILTAAQSLQSKDVKDMNSVHDVFISYRRNNGSHLASLLKVHLQMRGYRVFLDVDSLQEGDFGDRTLKSVESVSAGFILILTAGALDKCAIDHEGTDWVHKEIVTAIGNRRNIVPVTTESFQWPLPEDLPEDISPICYYNGVKWVHEYQDACVDKIIRFLRGQDQATSRKLPRIMSMHSVRSGPSTSRKPALHPNMPVRPSRSSDNLVETKRLPRPRQRDSPPGQDSQGSSAGTPATRGVPGAQSEDTRSLDQGDGASAPQERQAPKQYTPVKVSPAKTPDLPGSKKSPTRLSSGSSGSLSSAVNANPVLHKEVVKLEDVVDREQSSATDNGESESSSEYSSSEHEEERGGADGKNKSDVKVPAANARTVVAHIENIPLQEGGMAEKKPPASPEKKPSTKYKAPPPPHYEEAKDMPTPDLSDRRPLPSSRSAGSISSPDNDGPGKMSGSRASLPGGPKTKRPGMLPTSKAAARSKSAQDLGGLLDKRAKGTEKSAVGKKHNDENSEISPKSENRVVSRSGREISSDSDASGMASSGNSHTERTNADGDDRDLTSSSFASSSNDGADTSATSEESNEKEKPKTVTKNSNNNNGNARARNNGSRLPTPHKSNARSTGSPPSNSSASASLSPRAGPVRPAKSQAAPPQKTYKPLRKSASEQLQLTRPPPPGYPTRTAYPASPNLGYSMERYQAAMSGANRLPYPGHPPRPEQGQGRGAPAHGFDTAV